MFGSIVLELLDRELKQLNSEDPSQPKMGDLTGWKFIGRRLVGLISDIPSFKLIKQALPPDPSSTQGASSAITFAVLNAIASNPEPLTDIEANIVGIEFDKANRACIATSSVFDQHNAMLSLIDLHSHVILEIVKSVRKTVE